ncbi:MAG: hypothetical protein KC486_18800, partial [Myxococcales bacterium]|nr:hypothetical protein [Myxococcales bacterium]
TDTDADTGAEPREPGAVAWNHLVDAPEGDAAGGRGITIGGDDHVYVAGWIEGPASTHPGAFTNLDVFVRKITRDGAQVWTLVHDEEISGFDRGLAIAPLGADAVVVAGQNQIAGDNGDLWVRAIASDATVLWTTTESGTNFADDAAYGVTARDDGSLVVAGQVYGGAPMNDDAVIWLEHMTGAGAPLEMTWVEGDGDPWHASAQALALHPDGASIVAAGIRPAADAARIWVGRYDGDLAPVWTQTLTDDPGIAHGVAVTASGDPIVAAAIGSVGILGYPDGPTSAWIGRLGADDGAVAWSITRDETGYQRALAITIDSAGEVIVVGEAGDALEAGAAWIAKFDPADGSEIWSVTELVEDGVTSARALGVTTDSERNIYITGSLTMADGERLWVQRRAL